MRDQNAAPVLAAGLMLAAFPAMALPAAGAELGAVRGKVTVYTKDAPGGAPARPGQALKPGDRLTTGPRASAEVSLREGGFAYVGSDSDLVVKGIRHEGGAFDLAVGTLLVKTPLLTPPGIGCRVRTPTATAAGCGAEFGIFVPPYDRGLTHIAVFDEGSIEVRGLAGYSRVLPAGYETSVLEGGGPRPFSSLRRLAAQHRMMRWLRKRAHAAAMPKFLPSARLQRGR